MNLFINTSWIAASWIACYTDVLYAVNPAAASEFAGCCARTYITRHHAVRSVLGSVWM